MVWNVCTNRSSNCNSSFLSDPRKQFPERIQDPVPEPELIDNELHHEVESILKKRRIGRQVQYLVKWKGYTLEESTWEPLAHLQRSKDTIQEFENRQQNKQRPTKPKLRGPSRA